MHARFNLNDLDNQGLTITERLKRLLVKLDIKVDENAEDKSAILANALNTLATSGKIFEFKNALYDEIDQLKLNNEKHEKEMHLIAFIDKMILKNVQEERAQILAHKEKIKKLYRLMRAKIRKEAIAKEAWLDVEYEMQAEQIRENIRERINQLRNESAARLADYRKQLKELDEKIESLKQEKADIIKTRGAEIANKLDEIKLPSGENFFEGATLEQKQNFSEKFLEIHHNNERKITKLNATRADCDQRIHACQEQIRAYQNENIKNGKVVPTESRAVGEYKGFMTGYSARVASDRYPDPQIRALQQEIREAEKMKSAAEQEITRIQKEEPDQVRAAAAAAGLNKLAEAADDKIKELTAEMKGMKEVKQANMELNVVADRIEVCEEQKNKVEEVLKEEKAELASLKYADAWEDFEDFDPPEPTSPQRPSNS